MRPVHQIPVHLLDWLVEAIVRLLVRLSYRVEPFIRRVLDMPDSGTKLVPKATKKVTTKP